ncbi:hypothetical protein [Albimonas pacifica]|uniref:Uncharacterized protein n=1 Tax=Albimonas pacifica TaxID=1114924 RepID=A0A1I3MD18_9RHOB|nr:hypothetical protein [Albimonas pacifica]SFI94873.1 hypothetical protein SAMN05216258_11148 [Albimonas pacifica]
MSAPPPSRREIALDLFRDHHDLTRLSRAMALSRAERETAARRAGPPAAPADRAEDEGSGDPR